MIPYKKLTKVDREERIEPSHSNSRRIQWLDSRIIVQQAQNRRKG